MKEFDTAIGRTFCAETAVRPNGKLDIEFIARHGIPLNQLVIMSNQELYRFLLVTFAAAFLGQLIVIWHNVEGLARFGLMLVMWSPGLAAFLAGAGSRRRAWSSLKILALKMLPLALFLGWFFTVLQAILLVAGSEATWNGDLFPLVDGQVRPSGQIHFVLGTALQSFGFFALNWMLTLLAGSLVSVLPALGEELGWRAVLQPELDRRIGQVAATVTVGLLWGYWHLPINLAGANDSTHPILNALVVFPLVSILLAFPFAWLWRKTRSVWPVALCHGAGDAILGGLFLKSNSWMSENASLVAASVLIGLPFFIASWRADRRSVE